MPIVRPKMLMYHSNKTSYRLKGAFLLPYSLKNRIFVPMLYTIFFLEGIPNAKFFWAIFLIFYVVRRTSSKMTRVRNVPTVRKVCNLQFQVQNYPSNVGCLSPKNGTEKITNAAVASCLKHFFTKSKLKSSFIDILECSGLFLGHSRWAIYMVMSCSRWGSLQNSLKNYKRMFSDYYGGCDLFLP